MGGGGGEEFVGEGGKNREREGMEVRMSKEEL